MVGKKIGIIGAGIGGLSLGALLARNGNKVTIFEKEAHPGGRATTLDMTQYTAKSYQEILSKYHMHMAFSEPSLETIFKNKLFNGYHLDLGFHVFSGEIAHYLQSIIPDSKIEMIESKLHVAHQGKPRLFVSNLDKFMMLPNLLRLFLSSEKTMKNLETVSLTQTIKRYAKGKMKLVLELSPRLITTVNNLDKISTGEVFQTQRNMKLRGVRYPKKGLRFIIKALVQEITDYGGIIHYNTPVSNILISNNTAYGIRTGDKNYLFDYIISNIIVQNLSKIADETTFPHEYINKIKALHGTASLCAYYSLNKINKNLIGKNFIFIERDIGLSGKHVAGMVDFMVTLPSSGLAPKDQHLVQAYAICTPQEARDIYVLQKLRKVIDKNLENIMPNYQDSLQWAIYPVIYHLDGVAKTLDNEKPNIETPVQNLYLVGDCVKAPGIGLNCALKSAQVLYDILEKNIGE